MYQVSYRISPNNLACFGIEVKNSIVTSAAPIGKWMCGKSLEKIKEWVKKKGGTIIKIGG